MTANPSGLEAPQPTLKKNHSSATMATTTDSSTLAPSVVDNMEKSNEKSLNNSQAASRSESPIELEDEKASEAGVDTPSGSGRESEDESNYPKPLALGLITMALCLAVFLVALVRLSHVQLLWSLQSLGLTFRQ